MSGQVLSSQTLINQNKPVAIPYSDKTKYYASTIVVVSGTSITTINLPSYVVLSDSAVPTIIVSDGIVTTGQQPAYCIGYSGSNIAIAPTAGGNWTGNYTYKYTILNQF